MKIKPDGTIIRTTAELKLPPKTDGKRRTGDWLAAFLDHTAELESPTNYLRWAGLSTIAAVAQRKIYRETQAYFVYPNLYVWLVGPPGTKKTTAIRAGKRLLRGIPGVHFTPDAPSIVGIMEDFKDIEKVQKDHQSLNAFIGELSSLFENAAEGMTGFLTQIYDGDPNYRKRTRVGGNEEVAAPWFNMIAGTTPRWLGDNLTKNAVDGGLIARTVFVYSEELNFVSPEPEITPEFREREKTLTHDLAHIAQLYGSFEWAGGKGNHRGRCTGRCGCADAWRWYNNWYLDGESRLPRIPDNRTQGYFIRKPIHLMKVATLLSLAKRDDKLYHLEDMMAALALLDSIETGMKKAFSAVGTNPFATDLERIEHQIRAAGGMSYGDIVESNYHNLEDVKIQNTIASLVAMGKIVKHLHENGKMYYMPQGR